MRFRSLMIIAAIALVSACAAEDPLVESSAAAASETTVETSAPTTAPQDTAAETDDSTDHEDTEHADDEPDEADHEEADHEEADHDEDAPPVEATDARVIEVTMTEFAFEPSIIEVTPGETVVFVAKNVGAIEHELRLSNAHRIEEHIASGHADHDDEGGHHDEDADIILLVPAGETGELVFEVPEDATLYTHAACLIPGHYEAGMVAELTTSG